MSPDESWVFDSMDGTFEARLRRMSVQTRTSRGDGREITVSNMVGVVEAKFSYKALDRLYYPSFIAIEREVEGLPSHVIFEVVSINPIHYQQLGMDVSMPTVLRKEYLDTINESWGKSRETWIDLGAIPTWYIARVDGGELSFQRTRLAPLAGARAFLLSKRAVEKFLCFEKGEKIGTMIGFDLPLKINMENLVKFHCGSFGFSVDGAEQILYREKGTVKLGKIGELVDRYYGSKEEGAVYIKGIDVVSFDPTSYEVSWGPVQYVFRHRYDGKLLRFKTQTGRSVSVTPAHSLFVVKEGKLRSLQASEIAPGDYLIASRRIPLADEHALEVDLIEHLSRGSSPGVMLYNVPEERIRKALSLDIREWRSWRLRNERKLPVEYSSLLSEEERKFAKLGYKGCRSPFPSRLKIDEEISRLLGFYTAEGHTSHSSDGAYKVEFTIGLSKSERKIAKEIRRILESRFGLDSRVYQHGKNALRIGVSHRILCELLRDWVGAGARNKRVPEVVLNSSSSVRKAYLEAWVAGDYGVSVSRDLMNGILYLLLMEGCLGTVNLFEYHNGPTIEGRTVKASPRYQLKFPSAEKIRAGDWQLTRNRSEPLYPMEELTQSIHYAYPFPSHIRKGRLRLTQDALKDFEGKVSKLLSYSGSAPKSVKEAREDGFYRRNVARYLVKSPGGLAPAQALIALTEDLQETRRLAFSDLAFLRVESIAEVEPTGDYVYDVSVPGKENFLAGFGGVFCHNTGSGKSNLTSYLVRKVAEAEKDLTVVIFDVAGEYAVHLLDMLDSNGRILTNELIDDAERFYNSQAIPESLEEEVGSREVQRALEKVYKAGLVEKMSLHEAAGLDLAWIQTLLEKTIGDAKAGGTTAIIALEKLSSSFYGARGLQPATRLADLDEDSRRELSALLGEIRDKSHEKSGIRLEAEQMIQKLREEEVMTGAAKGGLTPEKLAYELASSKAPKLNILYLPDPLHARMAASRLISRLLYLRKRFGTRGRILIVLDEAQEYIPDNPNEKQYTLTSNAQVEALLRQGRKYRVHCWLATQRVAHLNVSALQQLHSYFVSTLPRMYDRMVVADSFALPYEVLERSAQLETGEWIFVSYKATKQKDVPIFVRTENNEAVVAAYLNSGK